ncbi:hypothetical protein PPYR_01730 [Photinus pyralis]|uniref:Tyr recombinase domain-containing protein n=1 Tax=Photinus pyralis TaxID=7054 RepID=A0A5N4B5Y0_PHOPY|nr:uncharacterized protein LOC116161578 [Photinus pyralis]KAB0804760.1 hypothetical protein PPYR_01730 [Photinus pyralis]
MDLPDEIIQEAEEASGKLIPEKSRNRYEKELTAFNEWRAKRVGEMVLNETVVLAYVSGLSKVFKASSLWTKFSMLKKALIVNGNVDISRFGKVIAFMKAQNVNYVPKKSKILSVEDTRQFILEASDDFLLCKVVLIFGLYGACRRDELLKLIVDDIEDHEKYALVKLQDTKTHTSRSFIIPDANGSLNPYEIYKKYAKLRPLDVGTRRFFLGYRKGKCVAQPAGMHTIGGVPRKVAEFLGLDHPEKYTGHCLRRSGASMVAESAGNLLPVKQIGGWKSSRVAEGYIEASVKSKMAVAAMIPLAVPSDIHSTPNGAVASSSTAGLMISGNSNCTIEVHMCKHNDCS